MKFRSLRLRAGDKPWLPLAKFDFHPKLYKVVKGFPFRSGREDRMPGSRWIGKTKEWEIPEEVVGELVLEASRLGYMVNAKDWSEPAQVLTRPLEPKLHKYQHDAVIRGMASRSLLVNFSMGLGKTATAIEWLKQHGFLRTLIVCPAMARRVWEKELEKWAEGLFNATLIKDGKQAIGYEPGPKHSATIISYGLLDKINPKGWDAIIFDEIHYLAYPDSARSRAAANLVKKSPRSHRLGLTGTPIFNKIDSIWHPLDILFPGRFGKAREHKETGKLMVPWDFQARYMNHEISEWGTKFTGVREEYKEELEHRLSKCSIRVSKQEVAHLLPSLIVQMAYADNKPAAAVEWAQNALRSGETHICLLTHRRKSAKYLAEQFKVPTFYITGELTPEQRHSLLDQARACDRAVVCATIDSTREAIDLTFCKAVAYVELPFTPVQIVQSLGRFHRLSSKDNVNITIFSQEGHDKRAEALAAKIEVVNSLIKPGSEEAAAESALGEVRKNTGMTEEELGEFLKVASEEFGGGW